jgi:cytochrome c-type biogenesis protein CcmH
MVMFSIAAVLLSALVAALILQRAAAAARRADVDPTLAVYRRQLGEIDDLAERGLLGEGELKTARAEAARRLLGAAKDAEPAEAAAAPKASRNLRLLILAGAVIAPALAAGLYLKLGSPGSADQPFADRLKRWSQTDPNQLTAAQMAAVLQTVVKSRPGDAEPLTFLARAQAASGNVAAAAETMRKAIRLEPKDGDLWANLGILLMMQGQGEETAPSGEAFRQALALDPKNAPARYHLARARIAAGDVNGGLADWRILSADLPADSAERKALDDEIAATAKAGHLIAPGPAKDEPPQQQAEAGGAEAVAGALTGQAPDGAPGGAPDPKAMVAQLAARLRQQPDDLAGWARLIRSYAVLGEPDKLKQALDQAHKIFKDRPDALKAIDSAAAAPQGSE